MKVRSSRALLIVEAEDEAQIHQQLADDPWAGAGKLRITSSDSIPAIERPALEGYGSARQAPGRSLPLRAVTKTALAVSNSRERIAQ